ncbi:MAG TPA: lipid II flippase MurJ [Acidimicrobiales bacterium]|nr:lipid II flippase MurJ [Acidimicrobiales bacterium]
MTAATPATAPSVAAARLGRSTLAVSGWNAVSRASGFARVLVVGAALGATFLGNTYQSANLVSTVTFELLAAGLLSAPLVPAFVGLLDRGDEAAAHRLASTLLGLSLGALGALTLVMAVGGRWVMELLTAGVDQPGVRAAEVRLGAFLLWFFLPQMLLYAAGAVATALLNARRRFAAAAFAPVANNVVVIATMAAFLAVTPTGRRGLELPLASRLVLAVGTTAGVLAMAAVPVVALARAGSRLRPRVDLAAPGLRSVARMGAWGAVLLAAVQVLVGVTLVLANRVEGGVVAYQIAFTFFLLPFALVAHPIFTTLHPRLSSAAHARRWDDFGADVAAGLGRTLVLVVPFAAVLAVLARPALDLVRLGALDAGDAGLVARVLAAYALGLGGYAAFQLLARAATAADRARLAAGVGVAVAAGGTLLMVAGSRAASGSDRVVALGLAHSAAMTVGAVALLVLLRRSVGTPVRVGAAAGRAAAAGLAAAAAAAAGAGLAHGTGRAAALLDLGAGGVLGVAAAGAVLWALRAPEVAALLARAGVSR